MNTGIEKLDRRSRERLATVHPKLRAVIEHAAAAVLQYIVTEGVRTKQRQAELVKAGASRTMQSKHLADANGFSRAVDLAVVVGGEIRWDWPLYAKLAAEVKLSAAALGVAIEWGGDWRTFKDGPHFQLADSVV